MKKVILIVLTVIAVLVMYILYKGNQEVIKLEDYYESGIDDTNLVELTKINDNVWVHTTYVDYNGVRCPANGMVVVTAEGLTLVDTPWTNEQTEELINITSSIFNKDYNLAIVTHAHADNMGGIDTLITENINVISTSETAKEAKKNKYIEPNPTLEDNTLMDIGDINIETYYPGEGHSRDNIVVYLPEYKVLFGGCLIKSIDTKNLGNTKEANILEWPKSIQNVSDKYPDAETIIPGHGDVGDKQLLEHTIELFND